MINTMMINGYKAVITYDSDIELFRGEFIGLNGGADFYGSDVESLRREGAESLKVFLEVCKNNIQGVLMFGLTRNYMKMLWPLRLLKALV